MKNIMIGLSGGVDSAVTAYLLQQQGAHVEAVFMQNWENEKDDPYCQAEQDLDDAHAVARHLGIPLKVVNFANDYWNNVFQHCLDEYAAGRTPNPDVLCNRDIKFKTLLDYALDAGADGLATGHYAQVKPLSDHMGLYRGVDPKKDQSYFLYLMSQRALRHACFPLGKHTKQSVRAIAHDIKLPNATKRDSTGICFIGERKFSHFLNEFLLAQPGEIRTIDGDVVGQHQGLMFHTLGQRKGLQLGGLSQHPEGAWYVIDKDISNNRLIVGQGHDHPRLLSQHLTGTELHWHAPTPPTKLTCQAQVRYQQTPMMCHCTFNADKSFSVDFPTAVRAITPGQSIVFYDDDHCLGGGIITAYTPN